MENKKAYFIQHKQDSKKYYFIFEFCYPEYNLDQQYKFHVRGNENLHNLLDKISDIIGKRLKKEKSNMECLNTGEKLTEIEKVMQAYMETDENNKMYLPRKKVNFIKNGKKMNYNTKCDIFHKLNDKLEFKILNQTYNVCINEPKILNMELPSLIFVGFAIYPSVFDVEQVNTKLSQFSWYKSLDKTSWTPISDTYSYTPNVDDLNHFLKLNCIPKNETKVGESYKVISNDKIKHFKEICPYEKRALHTETVLPDNSFRVISYNVLSDIYTKNNKFPYCPDYAINIDYRKQLIVKELINYNADIICLQEMDYKVYKNYLKEEMYKHGFKFYFDPKAGKSEGLSLFYRKAKFQSLQNHRIIISQEIQNGPMFNLWMEIKENPKVASKLIGQNTVYQLVFLQSKSSPNNILVVGNTHLFYHPEAKHIRLLQTEICLKFTNRIISQFRKKNKNCRISFIFCGDFNSQPQSGVYDLFTKKKVSKNHEDWKQNPDEKVTNIKLDLNRNMKSAYGAPKYTNYTDDFKGCLDYIFYEVNYLELDKTIPLPSEEEMAENTALPSIVVPSDHVALIADFKWK